MELSQFSAASLFSTYTSVTAMFTLSRQFYNQCVPELVRNYISSKIELWLVKKSKDSKEFFALIIDELDENSRGYNCLYQACHAYLENKIRSKATRLKCTRANPKQPTLSYRIVHGEIFVETLEHSGIDVQWKFSTKNDKGDDDESGRHKYFELSFNLAYKNEVLDGYIPLVVLKYYDHMVEMKKEIHLHTLERNSIWTRMSFNHPFTFDSLALEPELKKSIIDDLDMFLRRKDFYKKVGKAWKRGYLLYGPPGTGKSSLVAAMANYLRFDVYDLQLGSVDSDANLGKLMLSTKNQSILVIEDVDCTIGLSSRDPPKAYHYDNYKHYDDLMAYKYDNYEHFDDLNDEHYHDLKDHYDNYEHEHYDYGYQGNREVVKSNDKAKTEISLSGVLNFIDGLWSSCGDERIVIFTTNHKDRLDPAMLRPGRMDMHIHMSYLTMNGFRVLANNYLGVSGEHALFEEIEQLLETKEVTPAQVAEELLRSEDPDIALYRVIDFLKGKSKQPSPENKMVKQKTKSVLKGGKKVMKRRVPNKKVMKRVID